MDNKNNNTISVNRLKPVVVHKAQPVNVLVLPHPRKTEMSQKALTFFEIYMFYASLKHFRVAYRTFVQGAP